jgi:hypothetical protein
MGFRGHTWFAETRKKSESNLLITKWDSLSGYWFQFMGSKQIIIGPGMKWRNIHVISVSSVICAVIKKKENYALRGWSFKVKNLTSPFVFSNQNCPKKTLESVKALGNAMRKHLWTKTSVPSAICGGKTEKEKL